MKALVFNEQEDLPLDSAFVEPIVRTVLRLEDETTDEVSIYFVSKERICELHEQFFNDSSPTDCISLPMDKEDAHHHILGEVFICPQVAKEYVLKHSEEMEEDCYRELTLYLVHGLLHLLGYDDVEEEMRDQMRQREAVCMRELLEKDLLLRGFK